MKQQLITQIGKYTLVLTCGACPEQYDVYDQPFNIKDLDEGKIKSVAYLRLRHGFFRAEVPFGGKTVYEGFPYGDGIFDEDEREHYLNNAIKAIDRYISERKQNGNTKRMETNN